MIISFSGIIGANDSMHSGFIGIAPRITFGAYRVMNCNGKGEGDVIMTALQRAKDDGMNIINLSLVIKYFIIFFFRIRLYNKSC